MSQHYYFDASRSLTALEQDLRQRRQRGPASPSSLLRFTQYRFGRC
jgi:hypothetical protein